MNVVLNMLVTVQETLVGCNFYERGNFLLAEVKTLNVIDNEWSSHFDDGFLNTCFHFLVIVSDGICRTVPEADNILPMFLISSSSACFKYFSYTGRSSSSFAHAIGLQCKHHSPFHCHTTRRVCRRPSLELPTGISKEWIGIHVLWQFYLHYIDLVHHTGCSSMYDDRQPLPLQDLWASLEGIADLVVEEAACLSSFFSCNCHSQKWCLQCDARCMVCCLVGCLSSSMMSSLQMIHLSLYRTLVWNYQD
jgi:hypothetical protein